MKVDNKQRCQNQYSGVLQIQLFRGKSRRNLTFPMLPLSNNHEPQGVSGLILRVETLAENLINDK